MNSLQIAQILNQNPYTKRYFRGCVPADKIPHNNDYPYFVIVNQDVTGQPGTHWLFVWITSKQRAEFFDSFGGKPRGEIARFLSAFPQLTYNPHPVQCLNSQACAIYCILYAIQRCRNRPPSKIVSALSQISPSFVESLLE
jgi:hypothetical protein